MFRKMRRAPRSRPEREDRGPLSRRRRPGIYVLAAIGALTVAFLLILAINSHIGFNLGLTNKLLA